MTGDKLVSPESVEGVIIVDARIAVSPQRVSIDQRIDTRCNSPRKIVNCSTIPG